MIHAVIVPGDDSWYVATYEGVTRTVLDNIDGYYTDTQVLPEADAVLTSHGLQRVGNWCRYPTITSISARVEPITP